jgi:deoxyribodipyrimidine photolyase-like uncharacterized protein
MSRPWSTHSWVDSGEASSVVGDDAVLSKQMISATVATHNPARPGDFNNFLLPVNHRTAAAALESIFD